MDMKDIDKVWEVSIGRRLVEELVRCFEENIMRKVKLDIALLEAMKPVVAVILSVAYGASLSIKRKHDSVEAEASFSTYEDVEFVVDAIARTTEEMFSGRVMKEPSMIWKYKFVIELEHAEVTLCVGRIENNVVEPEVRIYVRLK